MASSDSKTFSLGKTISIGGGAAALGFAAGFMTARGTMTTEMSDSSTKTVSTTSVPKFRIPTSSELYSHDINTPYFEEVTRYLSEKVVSDPIDTSIVVPGTEKHTSLPVASSPDVNPFVVQIHTGPDSTMNIHKSEHIVKHMRRIVSYFRERGFKLPPPDYANHMRSYYAHINYWNGEMICFDISPDLKSMRLLALSDQYESLFINSTSSPLKDWNVTPLHIGIASSYNEFVARKNEGTPIAFFDKVSNHLFVEYASNSSSSNTMYDTSKSVPEIGYVYNEKVQLKTFSGVFGLFRRSDKNEMISANSISQTSCFVQVSPQLTFTTIRTSNGGAYVTNFIRQQYSGSTFSGLIIFKAGQGSSNYDVFTIRRNVQDAMATTDRFDLAKHGETSSHGGVPSTICVYDGQNYVNNGIWVSPQVLENPSIPEHVQSVLTSETFKLTVPAADAGIYALTHEFVHSLQMGLGITGWDYESMAVAFERDPRVNGGILSQNRSRLWLDYLLPLYRGQVTVGQEDDYYGSQSTVIGTRYGSSVFWMHIMSSFDKNAQAIRRMYDLLRTKYHQPVLMQHGLSPLAYEQFVSPVVGKLALKDALSEIHSMDIADMYTNYAVAVSLMRNNESIPMQYRMHYPFWFYSAQSPIVANRPNPSGSGGTEHFWSDLDQNVPIQFQTHSIVTQRKYTQFASGKRFRTYDNRTIIPSWPKVDPVNGWNDRADYVGGEYMSRITVSCEDLCMFVWTVPDSFRTITVRCDRGQGVRVVMFRYSPVNETGVFQIDGPRNVYPSIPQTESANDVTMDCAQFHGTTGYTKIVLVNTNCSDYGGIKNVFANQVNHTCQVTLMVTL